MSLRLMSNEEELSLGSGYDLESRFARQRWQILGFDDAQSALDELSNTPLTLPPTLDLTLSDGSHVKLYRQPLTVRRIGHGLYESDVLWNGRNLNAFEVTVRGRTTGGTQKILGSFFTAYRGSSDKKQPPDFKGLISYNQKTQEVEGCEIIVPVMELEIEATYPVGYATWNYLSGLADLTGTTNNTIWFNRQAGEVLYRGAEFTRSSVEPTRITHTIAISPNLQNLTTAGMKGVQKDGWDFLWFLTRKKDLSVQGVDGLVPGVEATAWYSERVYRRSNFAAAIGPLKLP